MTSNFNFGSFSNANTVNTSKPQLKPYDSYKVKVANTQIEKVTKKDDESKSWDTIKIYFEGEAGNYTHSIFFPDMEKDSERPKFKNADGHEYERPSNLERTMYLMLQMLTIVNPEKVEKFKTVVLPKAKGFEDVAKYFAQFMTEKKNKEVYIKLVGRNSNGSVYATLPDCVGLNKDGELFPVNVISNDDNFRWSNYEVQKQNEYRNAKPTNMTSVNNDNSSDITEDDIESLLD